MGIHAFSLEHKQSPRTIRFVSINTLMSMEAEGFKQHFFLANIETRL